MRKRTLYLLQAATALGGMGYGVMFTVLDDFRDNYGITEAQLGIIVGIGFITGFLSQILFAPLADKGHAKKLVMTGIAIEIVGTLFMAFGQAFLPLIIGRLLAGFGVGISEPALRRILILSDPERMGQNLGLIVSASVAGFTAGPIVSALTADTLGIAAPFLLVAFPWLLLVSDYSTCSFKRQTSKMRQLSVWHLTCCVFVHLPVQL
jgi:MFS family permease